ACLLAENKRLGSVVYRLQDGESRASTSDVSGEHTLSDVGNQQTLGRVEVCGEKLREDEQVRPISAATSGASVGWVNEVAPVPASVGNQQPGDRCRAKERRARSDPSADSNSPTERKLHKLTSQGSLSAKHVDLKQLLVDRSGAGNVEDKVPSILPSHAFCRSKRETSSGVSVDAAIQGGKQVELTTALSKIQALMGMVQTQENIEALLGQEIRELKKNAKDREYLWRLIVRWKDELEARGYAVENDIR
ncbi:unnamed protein product, partial [Sphacelaria rigidula]